MGLVPDCGWSRSRAGAGAKAVAGVGPRLGPVQNGGRAEAVSRIWSRFGVGVGAGLGLFQSWEWGESWYQLSRLV